MIVGSKIMVVWNNIRNYTGSLCLVTIRSETIQTYNSVEKKWAYDPCSNSELLHPDRDFVACLNYNAGVLQILPPQSPSDLCFLDTLYNGINWQQHKGWSWVPSPSAVSAPSTTANTEKCCLKPHNFTSHPSTTVQSPSCWSFPSLARMGHLPVSKECRLL